MDINIIQKLDKVKKNTLKLYYSIGEVADIFNVNDSLLRYWEKEFPTLKPKKNRGGTRFYTKENIEHISLIYHLVKIKGMTLAGARNKINENKEVTVARHELIQNLKSIKAELEAMRRELDYN